MNKQAILCVDDEALILMSIKQELKENFGNTFLYETALSADAAMDIIDELVVDGIKVILIISDWLMPGIKGDEFLISVKEKHPGIKAIMLTGHADENSINALFAKIGEIPVLYKPWTSHSLIQAVKTCISN